MNLCLAMLAAFFWGTTYAVTQYTLADWPPLLLGVLRALPAGLLLWLAKPVWPQAGQWPALLALGTVNIGLFFVLIFIMALTLPSAISAIGMVSVPVIAMLFHFFYSQAKPNKVQLGSGLMIIVLAWQLFDPSSVSLSVLGMFAMLAALCCLVLGSTLTKQLGARIHWWTILCWQLIIGGLLLTVVCLADWLRDPEPYRIALQGFSITNSLGLVWLVALNTALAYGLFVWLMQRMSVVEFAFGSISNPIAGILAGFILLGERYSLGQYSLMAGMIVMSLVPPLYSAWQTKRGRAAVS